MNRNSLPEKDMPSSEDLSSITIGALCEHLFSQHYRNRIACKPAIGKGVLDIATTVAQGIWKNCGMSDPNSSRDWRLELEETMLVGVVPIRQGVELNDRQLHLAPGVLPDATFRGYIANKPRRLSNIVDVGLSNFNPSVRDVLYYEKSGSLIFTLDPPSRPWLELRAELESQN